MLLLTKTKLNKILNKDVSKSYTYGLCRGSGELFYIGVGIRRRVFAHTYTSELTKSGNRLKTNITKKELEAGGLRYVLFCVNKDREVCLSLEKELIQHFGRLDLGTGSLANLTAGGEIGVTGVVVSQETREKLS